MQTINKKSKGFDEFRFVLSMRSKDSLKPVFTKVFVEEISKDKRRFICTDSRQLSFFETDLYSEFKGGFYDVIKANKSEIILNFCDDQELNFPNYRQIIPEDSSLTVISRGSNFYSAVGYFYREFYKKFPDCSIVINNEFLQNVFNYGLEIESCIVEDIAKSRSVYNTPAVFTSCSGVTAVIMPIVINA